MRYVRARFYVRDMTRGERTAAATGQHHAHDERWNGPVAEFQAAQAHLLDRYGVSAESRFVDVPAVGGRAHVLVGGEGPPLVLVIGGTIPAALWVPLIERLPGYRFHAIDLPGFGLTHPVRYRADTMRSTVVAFLAQAIDGLGLGPCPFVTQSQGSLWTTWLALDQPDRVTAQVQIGCPAHILGTSAPLPMRLMSIPAVGRLLLRSTPPSQRQVERVFAMVHEDVSDIPEIRDALLACERLPGYGASLLALMHAVMRLGRTRAEIALTADELARVRHPVQLVWGDRDPFGSLAVARRAAELIPDAELHVVSGGHAPWLNGGHEVGALARPFLNAHPT